MEVSFLSLTLGTVITAMVTPFDDRGAVNYKAAARLARYLIEHGSTGLVVSGTTGESPTLTVEEKLALFRTVVEAVEGRAAVIAGTGGNCTASSIKLTEEAAHTGVDALLLVTPYYNKPTQEGLYRHFRAVAEATDLPVMLYNVPGRTGVNMNAETVLRLAEIKNIVALKEASGNLEQAAEICAKAPPGFSVYSGDDALTLPMLSVGAVGVVSVASHLVGPQIAAMIGHFKQGRVEEATRLHLALLPLFRGLFMAANPIPVKAALNLIGLEAGKPRLPLLPLGGAALETLKELLQVREMAVV
ncbi:MAG: 4-hydroxy-tetrahydrodipicolinate synthase [Firmicutes bacterium]|jgi:4-hydroxy-tetrahydrodipicolinate synthase|nr:4-hydroxy-tetrahydrodipicolinate synthase [Bacillota bacterium]